MVKINRNKENLLDFFPVRITEWEKNQEGKIIIKKPKLQNRLFKGIIKVIGISDQYKIYLDDFGSYVWENCDGNLKVKQIGDKLRQKFGNKVEPVYERVGTFIKILASENCITYKGKE